MIPPLVVVLQPDPAKPLRLLGAWRDAAGRVEAGLDRLPATPLEGSLLLFWPTRFGWTPRAMACADAVRDRDGAMFPLATVLDRLEIRPGRGLRGLLAALVPDLDDAVDPALMGRRLVEELAARLEDAMAQADETQPAPGEPYAVPRAASTEADARARPVAAIRFALADLPAGPGVYSFLAADGRALYVGKAKSLRMRVPRHFDRRPAEPAKSEALARRATRLVYEPVGSDLEALLREQLALARDLPPLNTQERAHPRRRGPWRRAVTLLVLPSAAAGRVEICMVAGDGRFHWETAPRAARVPRDLWRRLGGFLAGDLAGWAPGRPREPLPADEARQLAEVSLSWLARHGDAATRIDLVGETYGRHLQGRLRVLLAADPAAGRTEAR
jgi:hypothetical protein